MPNKGEDLLKRLPTVRGRYQTDVELSRLTWFRVGGAADVVYKPADEEDLSCFLAHCPDDIPLHVIGVGSNLLVRDGGVRGVVIRLGSGFNNIVFRDEVLYVGAGFLDGNVALMAADEGLAGLEFLAGIPGTIGGALRMNAGAYGSEVKDRLVYARLMDRSGAIQTLAPEALHMTYRHTGVPRDSIFLGAAFRGERDEPQAIHARINQMLQTRGEAQPVNSRTGGSTFANPDGMKAWELIDQAGCRGLMQGEAQVSEKHCNFLINTGGAKAYDLETLGEEVRARVRATSGVELRWEIERMGEELPSEMEKESECYA